MVRLYQQRTLIIVGVSASLLLGIVLLIVLLQSKPKDVKQRQHHSPVQDCHVFTNGSRLFTNVTAAHRSFVSDDTSGLRPAGVLLPSNLTRETCPEHVRVFDVTAEETTSKDKLIDLRISKDLSFLVASSGDNFQVSAQAKGESIKTDCDQIDQSCFRKVSSQLRGLFIDLFARSERKVTIKGFYLFDALRAVPRLVPEANSSSDTPVHQAACGFTSTGDLVWMDQDEKWIERKFLVGSFVRQTTDSVPEITNPIANCNKNMKDWKAAAKGLETTSGIFCHEASSTEFKFDGSWRAVMNDQPADLWVSKSSPDTVRVGSLTVHLSQLNPGKCASDKRSTFPVSSGSDAVVLKNLVCGYGGKGYIYFGLPDQNTTVLTVSGAMTVLDKMPAKITATAENCSELRVSLPTDWKTQADRVASLKGKCISDGLRNITFDGHWRVSTAPNAETTSLWALDAGFGLSRVGFAEFSLDLSADGIVALGPGLTRC